MSEMDWLSDGIAPGAVDESLAQHGISPFGIGMLIGILICGTCMVAVCWAALAFLMP